MRASEKAWRYELGEERGSRASPLTPSQHSPHRLNPGPSPRRCRGAGCVSPSVRRSVGVLEFKSQCGDTGKAGGARKREISNSFLPRVPLWLHSTPAICTWKPRLLPSVWDLGWARWQALDVHTHLVGLYSFSPQGLRATSPWPQGEGMGKSRHRE